MILLLGGITVEHLNLYSRQIVRDYVSGDKHRLGTEVIQFMY